MDEAIRERAESALQARFDAPVTLRFVETLIDFDGARNRLYRATLEHPQTGERENVVIKVATPAAGMLRREWAAMEFVRRVAGLPDSVTRIYCTDPEREIAVMEDFGHLNEGILGEILLGRNRSRAAQALVAFNRRLAEIHGHTAGRKNEWQSLTKVQPAFEQSEHVIFKLEKMLDVFVDFSSALGQRSTDGIEAEIGQIRACLADPGPYLALTHGDATPANFYFRHGKTRIFDWETADFRHCLLDGVFSQVRYIYSVRAMRIPDDVRELAGRAYRETLSALIPEAGDTGAFERQCAACSLTWLAGLLEFYRQVQDEDVLWGQTTLRQRMFAGLGHVGTLPALPDHFPCLAEQVGALHAYFGKQWPAKDRALPVFPAFER